MALSWKRDAAAAEAQAWTSDRRLYLTADGRAVGEGDTDALSLLVPEGGRIPLADALRYGLVPAVADQLEATADIETSVGESGETHEQLADTFRPIPEA